MRHDSLTWIANRGIADDVVGDTHVRGKYRDVVLSMAAASRRDSPLAQSDGEAL